MSSHISTLKLHHLRLGELSADAEPAVREHLAGCALCRARASHQVSARRAFEASPEPPALRHVLHPQAAWKRHSRWVAIVSVLPLAASVLFVVNMGEQPSSGQDEQRRPEIEAQPVAPSPQREVDGSPALPSSDPAVPQPGPSTESAPGPLSPSASPASVANTLPRAGHPAMSVGAAAPAREGATDSSATRSKGVARPHLEAWVQAGDSARPLYTGESLGSGSRVQLRYDAMGKRFVTLAGRDSNGVVEIYATLAAGDPGLTNAPFSLTLDDSKGEQVFFAFATDLRPDTGPIQEALRHNPVRMEGAVVTSLVLRKD